MGTASALLRAIRDLESYVQYLDALYVNVRGSRSVQVVDSYLRPFERDIYRSLIRDASLAGETYEALNLDKGA